MKPTAFIPPVAVILAGTFWITTQTTTISRLEKENIILSERITARTSRPGETTAAPEKTRRSAAADSKSREPIDWKAAADQLLETQRSGGMGDMRTMMRFQQRLQSMSAEELLAALDEIATLDFPEQTRAMLEQTLLGPLLQKDPETALDRFVGRSQENHGVLGWQLSNGLKQWAEKDLANATAWFDHQIAAGHFDSKSLDGKSRSRQHFEGAFLSVLIATDPDAASHRLSGLPVEQRRDILSHHELSNIKEKDQPAFATLIRGQLPEKDQAAAIANPASRIAANGGYDKVTEYLDRIAATPAERAAAVEKTAESRISQLSHSQKITSAEIDEMRAWADTQSSGSADKATGKALANLANRKNQRFADSAELAAHYHAATGSDELLATFLESWGARSNKGLSRPLAEKITDEKRRAEILKNLQ